jgi:hypothetical protein
VEVDVDTTVVEWIRKFQMTAGCGTEFERCIESSLFLGLLKRLFEEMM